MMSKVTLFYGISIMNIVISSLFTPIDTDGHMGRSKLYNLTNRINIEKPQKKATPMAG